MCKAIREQKSKIKNGFTLAEVLVTLTLIGVVATLTLPALLTNVQKQEAGPALLRSIATLDTANVMMINEQDAYSFSELCGSNYATNCFEPFIMRKLGAIKDTTSIDYKHSFVSGSDLGIADRYITKNGFAFTFATNQAATKTTVSIDTNGIKGPNVVGKDLFRATIYHDDEGRLYAVGSKADPDVVAGTSNSWTSTCNSSTITDDFACAGSIIDNGGRVVYKWK